MISFKQNALYALRQMSRATHRGDVDAACKWTYIADRQVRMARCISDLEKRVHRPWPLPPKTDPLRAKKAESPKPPPPKKAANPPSTPTSSCPHSTHPAACFCNRGKAG